MREKYDIRVKEEYAHLVFDSTDGQRLGETVRRIEISSDDPRFERLRAEYARLRNEQGEYLVSSARVLREYSRHELAEARLFHLCLTAYFYPVGEECGTEYSYAQACDECGLPRTQTSDLFLDFRKIPKGKDMAATIAGDEWIISQRLAELMVDAKLTGFDIRPVRHKAQYQDDAMDFKATTSGRELLERAAAVGLANTDGTFWCWLNRREQESLLRQMTEEWVALRRERARRRSKPVPVWHQLIVTSPPVPCAPPTEFGIDPFEDDEWGKYRCSRGHVAGLGALSELTVALDKYSGADVCRTRELVGHLRRPTERFHSTRVASSLLLISPRVRNLFVDNKIKGYRTDVAHLV